MPSRLVMLKRTDTGETASWLLFLIPDADNGLSDGRGGFSGVALYATLAGIPVCAGRYDGGMLVGSASLLDESHSWEENACKLAELLPQDVHVVRIRPGVTTRGRHDIDGGCIDIVVIEGKAPVKIRIRRSWKIWIFRWSSHRLMMNVVRLFSLSEEPEAGGLQCNVIRKILKLKRIKS